MAKENGGKGGGGASKGGGKGGDKGERASIEEEILQEADADADEGDADGSDDETDEEDSDDESESSDDSGDDDGGEGEEADGDGGEDAEEGDEAEDGDESEEDVDAEDDEDGDGDDLPSLFRAQSKQIQTLVKALSERAEGAEQKGMTDEQWAAVEEKTGMKKDAFHFITEKLFKPALTQLAKNFGAQLAELKGASTFDRLAKDPKFKDVHAYRGRMEKFLSDFAPEVRSNPRILRMAYLAARGMGAKKAVQEEANRREVRKKITVKHRPGAGGAGAGGGKGGKIKLTPVQLQAAKLGGMSPAEYIKEMRQRKK